MSAHEIVSLESADRFLSLLGGSTQFTFMTFGNGSKKGVLGPQITHGTFDDLQSSLVARNEAGAGVFVTINETDLTGRKTENIRRVRAVFSDIDRECDLADLKLPIPPHLIVESSPRKWHLYWVAPDVPLEQFNRIQKAIAESLGGDPSACDLPRVMRLPGFLHNKGTPVQSRLAHFDTALEPYSMAALLEAFHVSDESAESPTDETASPSAEHIVTEGGRNSLLTRAAGSLRRIGMPYEDILHSILKYNATHCSPPLDEAEVKAVADSVMRYPVIVEDPVQTMTDVGNADRFVQQWKDVVRYVPEIGKWMIWENDRWEIDACDRVSEYAKETARSIFIEAEALRDADKARSMKRHAINSHSAARLCAMLSLAKSQPPMPLLQYRLDADPFLVGLENGVVDLRDGSFREAERTDYLTKRAPIRFDADATCPIFESFVNRIMGGDSTLVEYLQRAIGYSLTGDTGEQCFFFLHGSGANGKSTLLNLFKSILGDYALYSQPEVFMSRKGNSGGASSDLARLRGARFVISNEVEDGAHMAENLVKQITGGDQITARFLHKEFFEFTPQFKLWVAGNHRPVVKGDDNGIWRRIHLIPFGETIPEAERDSLLLSKLQSERSGILNWVIKGCIEWRRMRLNPPAKVRMAVADYRAEMDIIEQWLDEACLRAPGKSVSCRNVYDSYRQWVERCGYRSMVYNSLMRKLEERGFRRRHTRTGQVLDGLDLKAFTPEDLLMAA